MIIPRSERQRQLKLDLEKARIQALTNTRSFEKCLDLLLGVMNEIPEAEKFVLERKTKAHLLKVKKALRRNNG